MSALSPQSAPVHDFNTTPIQAGQRWRTRGGRIAETTVNRGEFASRGYFWRIRRDGMIGDSYTINESGRADARWETEFDLVELLADVPPVPAPAPAPTTQPAPSPRKHAHYFKNVAHLDVIDVCRTLALFGVTDQALGHAAKKLLLAGGRGAKDWRKDIQEAIDTLQRRLEMADEDEARTPAATHDSVLQRV